MNNISHFFNHASAKKRSVISALLGLLGYGVWAYWVNSEYGQSAAIKAAFTQGSYSFVVTFCNTFVIEFVYRYLIGKKYRLVITALMTSFLVCFLSWCINTVLGTPEVFMTILPGCIMTLVYGFLYTLTLKKTSNV